MTQVRKELLYMPRYALVGGITFAVDFAAFSASLAYFGEDYNKISLAIAAVTAYLTNFLGHKFVTFQARTESKRQLLQHLSMKLAVFGLRLLLMHVLVVVLGFGVWAAYATGLMLGIVTFLGSRWIFARLSPRQLVIWLWSILPEKAKDVVRFASAGSIGFGIFFVLLYVLTERFGFWYLGSSMFALVINYSVTFILQKILTFKDKTTHVLGRQIVLYALMVSGFYCLNAVLLFVLVEFAGMWHMLAQLIISVLLTVISLYFSKPLFSPKPPAAP